MTLKTELAARKLKYRVIAASIGVSVPTISHYCSGRIVISAERARDIHNKFGVPLASMRADLWPDSEMAA